MLARYNERMRCTKIHTSLDEISPESWQALSHRDNPFIGYDFLYGLEKHDCLQRWGWLPLYLCIYDDDILVAALPMYQKDNSYGEFVFDWAWADAYARNGLKYYPKLVVAVPYTPATGPRMLVRDSHNKQQLYTDLMKAALHFANDMGVSSLHYLFTPENETTVLENSGLLRRTGFQFHWHNHNYSDFDDFLGSLSSKKRKQIRKERRDVKNAGVEIELLHGHETTKQHWSTFHAFYRSTFVRKSGYATLTQPFFEYLAEKYPDQVILVLARFEGEYIAGTFNIHGGGTLYGRHWGCSKDVSGLHFELCYYRLIEYCIDNKLERFEAGAQGEHKLSRGFLPSATYSAHWLAHPAFTDAIADFLRQEQSGIENYMDVLEEHSPFRKAGNEA